MSAAGKSRSLRGLTIARLQGRRQLAAPIVQVYNHHIEIQSSTYMLLTLIYF